MSPTKPIKIFRHDPQADLDYEFDWSSWLDASETITDFTVTPSTDITLGAGAKEATEDAGKVTAWLKGGTPVQTYLVTCHIVTSAGREDDRTIGLYVSNR